MVHPRVIADLTQNGGFRLHTRTRALDVACGTGHSMMALRLVAPATCWCDTSAPMLHAARERLPHGPFVRTLAERLPFATNTFDLVTVSMAWHWFDQEAFVDEAARVLVPKGELWTYNLWFPGRLVGDTGFSQWYRDVYLRRYPSPARDGRSLAELLRRHRGLRFLDRRDLQYEVRFDAEGLRDYLTTQSNVEAALQVGARLMDVDAWLDAQLAPFFPAHHVREFLYLGMAERAFVA